MHLARIFRLQIERPDRGDEPERVVVPLQRDLGARVYIGQIEQAEELVLGCGLVVRQMCWAQDEPALLPCLQQSVYKACIK